jgi:hypothetical protein
MNCMHSNNSLYKLMPNSFRMKSQYFTTNIVPEFTIYFALNDIDNSISSISSSPCKYPKANSKRLITA